MSRASQERAASAFGAGAHAEFARCRQARPDVDELISRNAYLEKRIRVAAPDTYKREKLRGRLHALTVYMNEQSWPK